MQYSVITAPIPQIWQLLCWHILKNNSFKCYLIENIAWNFSQHFLWKTYKHIEKLKKLTLNTHNEHPLVCPPDFLDWAIKISPYMLFLFYIHHNLLFYNTGNNIHTYTHRDTYTLFFIVLTFASKLYFSPKYFNVHLLRIAACPI